MNNSEQEIIINNQPKSPEPGLALNPFLPERPANPPPLMAAKTSSLRLKGERAAAMSKFINASMDEEDEPPPKPPRSSTLPPQPSNPFGSGSEDEGEEVEELDVTNPFAEDYDESEEESSSHDMNKPPRPPAPRFSASGGVLPAGGRTSGRKKSKPAPPPPATHSGEPEASRDGKPNVTIVVSSSFLPHRHSDLDISEVI